MYQFFVFSSFLCGFFQVWIIHLALFGNPSLGDHILFGLSSGFFSIILHCLVFGIFTGSGKDTRLLVQRLNLNPEYITETKKFKRTVFPKALYAILWTLIALLIGGALASTESIFFRYAHGILVGIQFFYNAKTFYIEALAIKENSEIISRLNLEKLVIEDRALSDQVSSSLTKNIISDDEWGLHVYRFGRFLIFVGLNLWLPYIYIRYIMGFKLILFLPIFLASLLFLLGGTYLKQRYYAYLR